MQVAQTHSPGRREQHVGSCHYPLSAALPPSLCKSQLCTCNTVGLSGIQMASLCTCMAPETWATWRVLFPLCDLHLAALKTHSGPSRLNEFNAPESNQISSLRMKANSERQGKYTLHVPTSTKEHSGQGRTQLIESTPNTLCGVWPSAPSYGFCCSDVDASPQIAGWIPSRETHLQLVKTRTGPFWTFKSLATDTLLDLTFLTLDNHLKFIDEETET